MINLSKFMRLFPKQTRLFRLNQEQLLNRTHRKTKFRYAKEQDAKEGKTTLIKRTNISNQIENTIRDS